MSKEENSEALITLVVEVEHGTPEHLHGPSMFPYHHYPISIMRKKLALTTEILFLTSGEITYDRPQHYFFRILQTPKLPPPSP